ncbi:MAG: SusD/RagB family nutrient-binding outer membrane lipoprotein [Prevotellaceae bacterium]|jgi:hypothetical protein|nr:SusD/RagB family nutrient-binding outer membrane lipoprotein [Prevotellaceae bacterium]
MKNLKYIFILASILTLSLTSCSDWLDVNENPNSPTNESAAVDTRLPWIIHWYTYTAGVTNFRTSCTAGVYYSNSANPASLAVTWACAAGNTTTPYQTFFVQVSSNIKDMYNKAEKEGAYYYMAAANVFHALGFMEMLDLYGEMPYTDALTGSAAPFYDDGKTIFNGCIAKLDEAIELFGKTQEPTAHALSKGDILNGGDVNKWIKLCYGLKARYLLKLSKKAEFNPQDILDCLAKAPQSNVDNSIVLCYNKSSDATEPLFGDPIMTNGNWDYAAYGSNQRISQYYYDLLTNMRSSGVLDPRMSKIVPACMSNIKLDANDKVQSYDWLRSKGVDFTGASTRLQAGGATSIQAATFAATDVTIKYNIENATARAAFIAALVHSYTVDGDVVEVTYPKGSIYVNSTDYKYAGDTVYVNLRNNSTLTGNASVGEMDMNWYFTTQAMSAGAVGSTGSFQVRPNSDQEILTYHEMCFIKAEVLFRQGQTGPALQAYKDGIQAHLDMMQAKLTEWKAAGYQNPDMWPMEASDISAYISSAAVCQSAGDLTMADIMLQKYLAMGCSIENWNDMRRFNFSAGNIGSFGVVYPGYDRGPLFAGQAQITGGSKTDPTYWQRRWRLPATLELTYNATNARAINSHAEDTNIWCIPIWWDCATDDEYYNYIK